MPGTRSVPGTASQDAPPGVRVSVAEIVDDVRARGDAALADWSVRLDGVEPARAAPTGDVPEGAVLALADRVRRWHALQRPVDIRFEVEPGVELERRWEPLRSVGVYVPRSLVSTLVMCAVPAQVAGVERIVVVTPPAGASGAGTSCSVPRTFASRSSRASSSSAAGCRSAPSASTSRGRSSRRS